MKQVSLARHVLMYGVVDSAFTLIVELCPLHIIAPFVSVERVLRQRSITRKLYLAITPLFYPALQ